MRSKVSGISARVALFVLLFDLCGSGSERLEPSTKLHRINHHAAFVNTNVPFFIDSWFGQVFCMLRIRMNGWIKDWLKIGLVARS